MRTDGERTSSPWPILVAFGLVLAEVGVLFGIRPVSIAGLVLFTGSVAAILRESEFANNWVRTMAGLGAVLIALGLALVFVDVPGSTFRGQSIAIAGAISLFAAPAWVRLRATRRDDGVAG